MTWGSRPLPNITPDTERFWKAATDGELLLGNCNSCGKTHYYPRMHCPACFSDDVTWEAAEGTGTVYSYSFSQQVAGWPEDELPHVVAYVELPEGTMILTHLVDCAPDEVNIGTPVEVRFRETENEDIAIPVFTPTA